MFTYPYCNKDETVNDRACSIVQLFSLSLYIFLVCTLCTFFFIAPSLDVCLYVCLYPGATRPAVFPGWPASSIFSGSVSLCTLGPVMLSEQKISHSIRLKRSHSADKACAEGALSPCCSICCRRLAPGLSM